MIIPGSRVATKSHSAAAAVTATSTSRYKNNNSTSSFTGEISVIMSDVVLETGVLVSKHLKDKK